MFQFKANKSLHVRNKVHDSTDTLDSASSYEIRFERPDLKQEHQEARRKELVEKNNQWNILLKANKAQEEVKPQLDEVENLNDEKMPVCHPDELLDLNTTLTNNNTSIDVMDKSINVGTSEINTSALDTMSSSSATNANQKHDDESCISLNNSKTIIDTTLTHHDHDSDVNSDSFSLNDSNPRFINESDSIENIQIQLVEANVSDFVPDNKPTDTFGRFLTFIF